MSAALIVAPTHSAHTHAIAVVEAPFVDAAGQASVFNGQSTVSGAMAYEGEATHSPSAMTRTDSQLEDDATQPIEQVVQVDRGDTLQDLLVKAGVGKDEAQGAIAALKDVYNPRDLRAGQEVTLTFKRAADGIGSSQFAAVTLQPDAGRQVTAKRTADQSFTASETKREVTRQLAHVTGTIRSSLFEAASSNGLPATLVVEMIRALSYDVDFQRDIQPGDTFDVLFERLVDSKGQVVREGDMQFVSLSTGDTPISLYRYTDSDGKADYFNAKGESVRKALLKTPVDGAHLTSGFGMRHHPMLGYNKMHKGVDFGVAVGTPIMSAGGGVVEMAGPFGAYGYYVRVRHNAEYSTAYAHLSHFAQGIRIGKQVNQGQVIGYSGATGRATGPHLHYEVLVHNNQVNPMSVKFQSGTRLAGKDLERFTVAMTQTQHNLAQVPPNAKVASVGAKTKAE